MTIIVDGNSRGYAHHDSAQLSVGGFPTQAIFGLVKEVRTLYSAFPGRQVIVLWDGRAQWRYDLYPGYKGDRDSDPEKKKHRENYKKQVPFIQQTLARLGVRQLLNYAAEADDLAGYMCMRATGKVTLITGDRDWLQLVGPNVTWVDPRGEGVKVNAANFFQFTGYQSPQNFLQGKALQGDTSDTIDGIPGIGEKTAGDFLAEFGCVYRFLELVADGTHKPRQRKSKTAKTLHHEQILASPEGQAIYFRNVKLMNLMLREEELHRGPLPPRDQYHNFKRKEQPDLQTVRRIFEQLAFVSILKDFDNFMRPFLERSPAALAA
jgi:DNA polymerase-1